MAVKSTVPCISSRMKTVMGEESSRNLTSIYDDVRVDDSARVFEPTHVLGPPYTLPRLLGPRRRQRLSLGGGGRGRGRTGYHHSRGNGADLLDAMGEESSYVSLGCVSTGASPGISEAVLGMEARYQHAGHGEETAPLPRAAHHSARQRGDTVVRRRRRTPQSRHPRRGTADRWICGAASGAQLANSRVTSSQFAGNWSNPRAGCRVH